MPKRSSNKTPRDINELAAHVVAVATGEAEESAPSVQTPAHTPAESTDSGKNPAAVALGRLGGKKGGKARAENLSPERRKEIAQKAARARWQKT